MNRLEAELETQMLCLESLKQIQEALSARLEGNGPEIDLDKVLLDREEKLKTLENSRVFLRSLRPNSTPLDENHPLFDRFRKIHDLQIALIPKEEKLLARLEKLRGDRPPQGGYGAASTKSPGLDFQG